MLEFLTEKCFEKLNEVSIKRPDDVVRIKEFPDVTFIKYGIKGVKDEEYNSRYDDFGNVKILLV